MSWAWSQENGGTIWGSRRNATFLGHARVDGETAISVSPGDIQRDQGKMRNPYEIFLKEYGPEESGISGKNVETGTSWPRNAP